MAATEERSAATNLFDILQPVCSDGSPEVHLAPHDWDNVEDATLCGLAVGAVKPDKTYLKHGCLQCALRAVGAGVFAVRENGSSVTSLGRFIESRMPAQPSAADRG